MVDVNSLRRIPSVDVLMERPAQVALVTGLPRTLVVDAVRATLDRIRGRLKVLDSGEGQALVEEGTLDREIAGEVEKRLAPSLVPVINATGVVVHTNLGRSPLGRRVVKAIESVACGYCNLEYDLDAGRRGSRHVHVAGLFRDLTGAEDALVVNNTAAAVLLILTELARDREVIVSRGELVEIGGSFRIPEVMEMGGAILKEVGATNRTRIADYERAVGDETAMLLKAHRSNFAIVGFTEEVPLEELSALGRERGIPVVHDLGSGSLVDVRQFGVGESTVVRESLDAGADLVCFSGDKLLGGPQCGVILGSAELIARLRKSPLVRALRIGKLTIAALEATVRAHLDGGWRRDIPMLAALSASRDELRTRAVALLEKLRARGIEGVECELIEGESTVGGGSVPLTRLPTWQISLRPTALSDAALESGLRAGTPPVISRVADGRVLWDVRTLNEDDLALLPDLLACAAKR